MPILAPLGFFQPQGCLSLNQPKPNQTTIFPYPIHGLISLHGPKFMHDLQVMWNALISGGFVGKQIHNPRWCLVTVAPLGFPHVETSSQGSVVTVAPLKPHAADLGDLNVERIYLRYVFFILFPVVKECNINI